MCTVSFLPLPAGNVLTSNRDEHFHRPLAFAPHVEKLGEVELTYPKDPKSGGSWIAAKSNGDAAVLLNGAFENHEKRSDYKMSRGLILLEVIKSNHPVDRFQELDLHHIENFTIIIFNKNELIECRWDGLNKHIAAKDKTVPHLWSSATLYDKFARKQREEWFSDWLRNEIDINPTKIIDFHRTAGSGDHKNGLVMDRNNGTSTFSITSIYLATNQTSLTHYDLKNDVIYSQLLPLFPNTKA